MMLKRTYIDDEGRTYYTLEFVSEDERERVENSYNAWDDRIKLLLDRGHELCQNGNKLLDQFGQSCLPARMRVHLGLEIIEWAQSLLYEARELPLQKQLQKLEGIADKVAQALETIKKGSP